MDPLPSDNLTVQVIEVMSTEEVWCHVGTTALFDQYSSPDMSQTAGNDDAFENLYPFIG